MLSKAGGVGDPMVFLQTVRLFGFSYTFGRVSAGARQIRHNGGASPFRHKPSFLFANRVPTHLLTPLRTGRSIALARLQGFGLSVPARPGYRCQPTPPILRLLAPLFLSPSLPRFSFLPLLSLAATNGAASVFAYTPTLASACFES